MSRTTLTAAAARLKLDDRKMLAKLVSRRQEWQSEAWNYFDLIGEVHYAVTYLANACAQLRLYVGKRPTDRRDDPEVDEQATDAAELLDALATRTTGHADIVREAAINLMVPGECHLVGLAAREDDGEVKAEGTRSWDIRSIDELEIDGRWGRSGAKLKPSLNSKDSITLSEDKGDYVARIWLKHPRFSEQADSPMRAILSSCEEIVLLEKDARATTKSRASNGILLIPEELALVFDEASDGSDPAEPRDDGVLQALEAALVAPVLDEGSASAIVPLMLRAKAEYLKELRHVLLSRPFDEMLEKRMERALRRLAHGLNVPPEIIMGFASANHWSGWLIDEQTYRAHVRPLAITIVDALTSGYLWPLLEAAEVPDPEQWVVWFDPSELLQRPNRGDDAKDAHDRMAISDEALLRALGFDDTDAPEPIEIARRILQRRGPADVGLTEKLFELIGVELPEGTIEPGDPRTADDVPDDQPQPGPPEMPDGPELTAAASVDTLGKRLARIDASLKSRLLVAVDAQLTRALERSAQRIRSAAQRDEAAREITNATKDAITACATLGTHLVAALGLDAEAMLEDELDALRDRFDAWVDDAQRKALRQLDSTDIAYDEDAVRDQQERDREDAWAWLLATLVALGYTRLFTASVDATDGEYDATLLLPYGIVREAVARAGGAHRDGLERLGQSLSLRGERPVGGIGTGSMISDILTQQGYAADAWEWEYGEFVRTAEFEPHRALDGVVFGNFDDERLRNFASFPPTTHYMPGDHDGCRCDAIPVIVAPTLPGPLIAAAKEEP